MPMELSYDAVLQKIREKQGGIQPAKPKTLNDGYLKGIDCKICNNTGYILTNKDGELRATVCECIQKRNSLRLLEKSGLKELAEKSTFKNFKTSDGAIPDEDKKKLETVKTSAVHYVMNKEPGNWYFISGTPGSGKTHICTAICNHFIKQGSSVRYIIWRELAQELKAHINEPQYASRIEAIKQPDVLYIDDFMKGSITESDVNRAIEVISARYNAISKRTIISSELSIKALRELDEAMGSRIYERAKNYCLKAPNVNWRIR